MIPLPGPRIGDRGRELRFKNQLVYSAGGVNTPSKLTALLTVLVSRMAPRMTSEGWGWLWCKPWTVLGSLPKRSPYLNANVPLTSALPLDEAPLKVKPPSSPLIAENFTVVVVEPFVRSVYTSSPKKRSLATQLGSPAIVPYCVTKNVTVTGVPVVVSVTVHTPVGGGPVVMAPVLSANHRVPVHGVVDVQGRVGEVAVARPAVKIVKKTIAPPIRNFLILSSFAVVCLWSG